MTEMRLAKFIGHSGYCSRKQASRYIDNGDVTVNGRAANHIDHITDKDVVEILGQLITVSSERVYYAYHKPVGIECKINADDPCSIYHHLPKTERVYPIGRLDKDSRGLLILTNDGEFCNQMTHPDFKHQKQYQVQVQLKPDGTGLNGLFASTMAGGLIIDGKQTLPCQVNLIDETHFDITLTQGLNRQIRKMSQQLGFKVIDLKRVRFEQYLLAALPEGQWVAINQADILVK
jgi:16S rRNA pseudouridine516 synthase